MRSGEAPAPATLPLLCALGRHKTDGLARWNAGYYFARCTRCRRDLVRTAFTRWQIPRGFRVVWQGDAGHAAEAVPPSARHTGAAGQVEFPIREEAQAGDANRIEADVGPSEEADIAAADHAAGPGQPARDEHVGSQNMVAAGSASGVPLEDILRSVPGLAGDPFARVADRGEERGWPEEHRFQEEDARRAEQDVRFDPEDRLADFATAEQDPTEQGDAEQDEAEENAPEPEAEAEALPDAVEEPAPPPAALPPVESKYPVVPDFMNEGPAGVGWDVVSGRIVPQYSPPAAAPADTARNSPRGLLSQGWQDLVRKGAQGAGDQGRQWMRGMRAASPRAVGAMPKDADTIVASSDDAIKVSTVREAEPQAGVAGTPPVAVISEKPRASERAGGVGHFLMHQSPVLAAAIFGGLVVAAAVVDSRNKPERVVVYRPTPPGAAAPVTAATVIAAPRANVPTTLFATPRAAFVTASMLKCRSMPSNDATLLRKLERGAPVKVLGANPGWSSIAHQGRQCWVATQHLSATRPA